MKIEYLDGKAKYSQVLYVKVKNLFELENKTKYGNLDSPPKNINYLLDKNSRIQISILDSEGNTVAIVMDAYQKEGLYSLLCNLDNLKPGVYFIKMDAEFLANNVALSDTQKIVSLR